MARARRRERRTRWTTIGIGSGLAATRWRSSAGGSRTSSVCRGRSCPTRWRSCSPIPTPARAQRTMSAMPGMKKLDIAALKRAHDGERVRGRGTKLRSFVRIRRSCGADTQRGSARVRAIPAAPAFAGRGTPVARPTIVTCSHSDPDPRRSLGSGPQPRRTRAASTSTPAWDRTHRGPRRVRSPGSPNHQNQKR